MTRKTPLYRILRRSLLLLATVTVLAAGCDKPAPPQTAAAFVLPEAAPVSGFELRHHELGKFDLEDTRGQWALLFFGYTHCPDVCPTELFMLAETLRGIEKNQGRPVQPPRVVFVSVDPARDALDRLQQYAAFYHPDFIGVTGEQATIDRLCRSVGVFYERVYYRDGKTLEIEPGADIPEDVRNSYLINHAASVFLLNPAGRLHAIFTPPHDPQKIIADLAVIQSGWDA